MLQDAGLTDLMRSIAKQGFFPGEPLLVSPGAVSGQYVVVEGNRRLSACTLLAHPELAPRNRRAVEAIAALTDQSRIDPVPCLVFQTRDDILAHLGYRHVTGIKEWEPLAKARFLDDQFNAEGGTEENRLREIARSIGSRADYVGRLLVALRLYRSIETHGYFGIAGLSERQIEFSLISSVLAYADIVEYLGLDSSRDLEMPDLQQDRLELLTRILFERKGRTTQLGESRNIRALATVLANPKGPAALQAGLSVIDAAIFLEGTTDAFRGLLSGARSNLTLAIENVSGAVVTKQDLEDVGQVQTLSADLLKRTKKKLEKG